MKSKLSLGFQMGETFKMIGKRIATELQSHNLKLTMEQFLLLHGINKTDDISQHELAEAFGKDKSAILRLTDELERKQMVVRMVDSTDRRRKALMLTKKGMEALKMMEEIEAKVVERMLVRISEADLKTFSKVLTIIQQNAKP